MDLNVYAKSVDENRFKIIIVTRKRNFSINRKSSPCDCLHIYLYIISDSNTRKTKYLQSSLSTNSSHRLRNSNLLIELDRLHSKVVYNIKGNSY